MKKTIQYSLIAALLAGSLLLAACSPAKAPTPTLNPDSLITEAAATVAAQLTQNAALTPSVVATNTSEPTVPPLPTQTVGQADQPTLPAVTDTPTPASQPTKSGDAGSFVADVTVPDGTGAAPGSAFDKIWRIKNTGVTTWNTTYSLVWVDGEKMGAPDNGVQLPKEVRPGETVDITMHLTAPTKAGSYQTFFRLKNANGQFFRLDGTGDLWIKITVGGSAPTPNLTQTAAYTPGASATPTLTPTP